MRALVGGCGPIANRFRLVIDRRQLYNGLYVCCLRPDEAKDTQTTALLPCLSAFRVWQGTGRKAHALHKDVGC